MAGGAEEVRRARSFAALLAFVLASNVAAEEAISYGEGGCGKVTGAVELPCSGVKFEAFSRVACMLGRTYLHPLVVTTVIDAYAMLDDERRWQYGEMGFKNGGRFKPHRTHQNGASADFFTPLVDGLGKPVLVPISVSNKFGYSVELDREGRGAGGRADWKAIGAHLGALRDAGRTHGVGIKRVISAPEYIAPLMAASPGIRDLEPAFMKKPAWVRHDEHYHVDFSLPAALTRPLVCK